MNYGLKEKITNLRRQGKTYKEIHQELNCSRGTISHHCSKMRNHKNTVQKNIEQRKIYRPDLWEEKTKYNIKLLYNFGINTREIADIFNKNHEEVKIFSINVRNRFATYLYIGIPPCNALPPKILEANTTS